MENEQDYLLRGNSFLYEALPAHFVIKWIEQVHPEKLQESVQAVIRKSPYVCWSLIDRNMAPKLVKASGPFLVHDHYEKRQIPETPGGYLFSISCEKEAIHFVYDHFLTDGKGIVWLISEILLDYCSRVYGISVPYTPLPSSQLPAFRELLKYANSNTVSENIPPLARLDPQNERFLLRIDKNEIVQKAISLEIKPFALLLSVLCRGVMLAREQSSISYTFTADARKGFNCEDVFYNFSTSIRNTVSSENGLSGICRHFQEAILCSHEPAVLRLSLAQGIRVMNALSEMELPYAAKKKVYHKISHLERVNVRASYLGSLFQNQYETLNRFVTEVTIWMDSDHEDFTFVETTMHDRMTITVSHCMHSPNASLCLLQALKEIGIFHAEISDF